MGQVVGGNRVYWDESVVVGDNGLPVCCYTTDTVCCVWRIEVVDIVSYWEKSKFVR